MRWGSSGIVRQRQAAIVALARAVASGQIALHPGADIGGHHRRPVPAAGIGDWTAQYIAPRALRWPDAFRRAMALHKALGVQGQKPARRRH